MYVVGSNTRPSSTRVHIFTYIIRALHTSTTFGKTAGNIEICTRHAKNTRHEYAPELACARYIRALLLENRGKYWNLHTTRKNTRHEYAPELACARKDYIRKYALQTAHSIENIQGWYMANWKKINRINSRRIVKSKRISTRKFVRNREDWYNNLPMDVQAAKRERYNIWRQINAKWYFYRITR